MIYVKSPDGSVFAYESESDMRELSPDGCVIMSPEEVAHHLDLNSVDGLHHQSSVARFQRSALISNTDWLVNRHRDELDIGSSTTITASQYSELQEYRRSLRDWPEAKGWPNLDMPTPPNWL
ncbi:phage tail assembly chaperone [Aeromonas jandaei]|uniref:phage tail assembly chaperone n=1 Tax=Aeromonas jandaei TaxID=650 RepID=UPI001C055750|nr:phage tail assembly chaperone [Aeromonas jandaei]